MWGLPLQSPNQVFLWEKPLPSYAVGGSQGANILSVLSEAFSRWEDNLNINKHIIAAPSRSRRPSVAPRLTREKGRLLPAWARLRDQSPSQDSGYASENSRSPARSLTRQASRGSGLTSPSHASSQRPSPDRQGHKSPGPHMFFVQTQPALQPVRLRHPLPVARAPLHQSRGTGAHPRTQHQSHGAGSS